ncbi:putative ternary complex factor MIP1, leucine-zipper [Helianthus annuus]|nr:putative ternary complex factor MIP1, leucine-zipper [Helianthus annuus]
MQFLHMLRVNCDSTPPVSPISSRHSSFQGCSWNNGQIIKDDHGVLDMAPRASYNLNPDAKLGKIFLDQSSVWSESEMTPCSTSLSSNTSNCTPNSKSSMELVKEITSLETEILHLERYLLSLYRTAFQPHVHGVQTKKSSSEYKIESQLQTVGDQSIFKVNSDAWSSGHHSQLSTPREGFSGLNRQISSSVSNSSSRKERKTVRCSLGDHFGASCANDAILDGPDKLSEDIIRCISLIYCKLGDQNQAQSGPLVSSASSLSSSGTNCTRNLSDTWSPYCNEEPAWDSKHDNLKEERRPDADIIEVLKINVDDDKFNYASRMLKKYRTLVKKLETVDPGKMKREQKLAFWINIHNALVMHAYLAYGTHNNTKSNSILKATYNIGGHSVNAYLIQISILGIKSHFRSPWLQSLLSPGRKLKMEPNKHMYAIEYPEPLVHFSLSLGSFSDPAVRVYNAKTIFQDLRLAKEEFIRSTVYVNKETRIYLPKILYFFAKDMAMSMASLLEIVNACLPESQQKLMKTSIKGKPEKCVYWLSQSCIFRYAIHRETVEGGHL